MGSVLEELQSWDVERLTALLDARADLRRCRDLAELARFAGGWGSPREAVERLTAVQRTVLEAVSLLPPGSGTEHVRALWADPPDADVVDAAIEQLRTRLLLHPATDDLRLVGEVGRHLPHPLGLGRAFVATLEHASFYDLQALCQGFDLPRPRSKVQALELLAPAWHAPTLATSLADAPVELVALLRRADDEGPVLTVPGVDPFDHLLPDDPAVVAAVSVGLLSAVNVNRLELPREVGLALRWPATARRPLVPSVPDGRTLDDAERETTSAEAVRSVLATVDGLAVRLHARALPRLSSGSVGVKEVRQLAKDLAEPTDVALLLPLLQRLELLTSTRREVRLAARWNGWSELPDAERWAQLVSAWWSSIEPPVARPGGARALKAVLGLQIEMRVQQARRQLVRVLEQRGGVAHEPEGWLTVWHAERPEQPRQAGDARSHQHDRDLRADLLAEATALGLLAAGAVNVLLGPYAAGEPLQPLLDGFGSSGQESVHAQADMTLVCTGPPSRRMRSALDRIAAVEQTGAATVWRISEVSLATAFGDGDTVEQVLAVLAEFAGAVPQSMAYLVGDAQRRHGRARVGRATSYVVVEDDALLLDALGRRGAVGRELTTLGVRRVAPGVAVSTGPTSALLEVLRQAGIAAVPDVARAPRTARKPKVLAGLSRDLPVLPRPDPSAVRAEAERLRAG